MAFPYMEAVVAALLDGHLNLPHFHFLHDFITMLMGCANLVFWVLPWYWKRSGDFLVYLGFNADYEIVHTFISFTGIIIWSQITDLPFSLYSAFVIKARHGFNKQTVWLFFRDMIKRIILSILVGLYVVAPTIVIVQSGGPYLAIYLWGFMFALSLAKMTIYPTLIAPLFNKFTPLPEGELREKIENLASSLRFPLKKLFVVDGSTRSSHSNACMYGFFKNKRIVLYDTLIKQGDNLSAMNTDPWSAMNTDPWYSTYHYSHPRLVERLAAIDEPAKGD